VAELGLSGRFKFYGRCDWDQIAKIFHESHLAILTSKHEGFCLGLAEAMGAGLPAIAFSCGGVIEQYLKNGINGYVVPWGDVGTAADRIVEFYDDPEKWRNFSREAREEIRGHYSMAAFGAAYARLFEERLTRKTQPRRWPRMRPILADRNRSTCVADKLGRCVGLW
jgi:glycosyltransferase involved in cell wall biosynthesis